MNAILKKLQSRWQGPAIDVVVKGKTYTLGTGLPAGRQGEAKTRLIVHSASFLPRLLISPSLAFGEAYMNGDIEVEGNLLDILEGYHKTGAIFPSPANFLKRIKSKFPISINKAIRNVQHHYDIGNDFFALWLDKTRTYSCAYFLNENDSIDIAQQQKLELICRKARLAPGQTMLDIGCGWGPLLFHAVKNFGVKATGITAATEQAKFVEAKAKEEGLSDKINVIRGEWRGLQGKFDRVVSVGMFEQVPLHQYAAFFKKWRGLLVDDGLSFLHTIGRRDPISPDPWMTKYIFPDGFLPTLSQISNPVAKQKMFIADVENLWHHYDLTLQRWLENFEQHVPEITRMFDEKFVRMWRLYLMGAIAFFRWGNIHLWQLVMLPAKSSPWPFNREVGILKA